MTAKTKNVLIYVGAAVAVIAVIVVLKKAAKATAAPVVVQSGPSMEPVFNNWDGAGGYSVTLSDGSSDYYDKYGNYKASD